MQEVVCSKEEDKVEVMVVDGLVVHLSVLWESGVCIHLETWNYCFPFAKP